MKRTARRWGQRSWARLGVLIVSTSFVGVGCLKEPTNPDPMNDAPTRSQLEGALAEYPEEKYRGGSGESDPGYNPPEQPGAGNTVTRARIPLPKGSSREDFGQMIDESTAPRSEVSGVKGSAASGMYLQAEAAKGGEEGEQPQAREEGIGGAGIAGIDSQDAPLDTNGPRETVNPGRGTLPRREGIGTSRVTVMPKGTHTSRWEDTGPR